MEIRTQRLVIRKFRMEDKDDVFEILSDEQTTLDEGGFHSFSEMDQEYQTLMERFLDQERYGIVCIELDKVIGMISLQEEDRAINTYELGFVIHPKYRRKGYAYEAVSNLMSTMFRETEIEMFTASHFPYNVASKELITKLGFVYEGIDHKAMNHAVYGPIDLVCYYKEK